MMRPDLDSATKRDLTGYLDEDGQLRLCVTRLTSALTGLLGSTPGQQYAAQLRELAVLAREVGDLCEVRAREVESPMIVTVDASRGDNEP